MYCNISYKMNPEVLGYSPEARKLLAMRGPFLNGTLGSNPYKEFAYIPPNGPVDDFFNFDEGNFVLNLGLFLREKFPIHLKDPITTFARTYRVSDQKEVDTNATPLLYLKLGNNFPSKLSDPDDSQFKKYFSSLLHPAMKEGVSNGQIKNAAWNKGIWTNNIEENRKIAARLNISERSRVRQDGVDIVSRLVPFFAILGPEDYCFEQLLILTTPRKQAMLQVAHSYVDKDAHDHFNMPASYYALVSEEYNTVYLCIDSSTLLFDKVQQQWLLNIYTKFKALFPDIKFCLISYHSLRYVEFSKTGNASSTEPTPEWSSYKQSEAGLSPKPSIIINREYLNSRDELTRESTLDYNRKGSGLGLNGNIGSGIELFLTANNIVISTIYASYPTQVRSNNDFELDYVNGHRGKVTQHRYALSCQAVKVKAVSLLGSDVDGYKNPYLKYDYVKGHWEQVRTRLEIDTARRGNKFVNWVLSLAKENLLSSKTWGNPPLDLSLLRNPELWRLNETSDLYSNPRASLLEPQLIRLLYRAVIREHQHEISGFSEETLYEYLRKIGLKFPSGSIFPPKFYQTIAMLLDTRYNPAFLVYALLNQELKNNGIYIVETRPKVIRDASNLSASTTFPSYYFELTLAESTCVCLTMALRVDRLFDNHSGRYLEPVRMGGGGLTSPLSIDIKVTVDLFTGEITNSRFTDKQWVSDQPYKEIIYSPYNPIIQVLKKLDEFRVDQQNTAVASLLEDYLHEPVVSPVAGQATRQHKSTIANLLQASDTDLSKINKCIRLPLEKMLPYSTTSYLADSVWRYRNDDDYRKSSNIQYEKDIGRILRLDGCTESFASIETLIARSGAYFLTEDEKILLKLVIRQTATVNPLSAVTGSLFQKYFLQRKADLPWLSLSTTERLKATIRQGTFLVDQQKRKCSIVWQASFDIVRVTSRTYTINSTTYDKSIVRFFIETNVTTDPKKFIQNAYLEQAPEAKKIFTDLGLENILENLIDHWEHNYADNLRLLEIGEGVINGRSGIFDQKVDHTIVF